MTHSNGKRNFTFDNIFEATEGSTNSIRQIQVYQSQSVTRYSVILVFLIIMKISKFCGFEKSNANCRTFRYIYLCYAV